MLAPILTILKTSARRYLDILGLDARKRNITPQRSFVDALEHVSNMGLYPATVLDVGAAHGTFTLNCHAIFPRARYLMIDPLQEYESHLNKIVASIPQTEYVLCAASASSGEITINVHPDLVGSSIYLEREESDVNGVPRTAPAETLDRLCEDRGMHGPYLLKVDVQGAELDVLAGAEKVLSETEYLIMEVSLFEFFSGGPQFYDVVSYMKSCEFVVYDILGLQFRPLDNALSQVDLAFVREDGQFRKHHFYASPKQREEQTKRLVQLVKRLHNT